MSDIVEQLEKFGSKWPYDAALDKIKSLRQQLAESVKIISEQDFEYNRKTNAMIKRHVKQLTECQAREKALRDCLAWYVQEDDVVESMSGNEYWADGLNKAREALAMPSNSTALDEALKQAKREALVEASVELRRRQGGASSYCDEYLEKKAKELK